VKIRKIMDLVKIPFVVVVVLRILASVVILAYNLERVALVLIVLQLMVENEKKKLSRQI